MKKLPVILLRKGGCKNQPRVNVWQRKIKDIFHSTSNLVSPLGFRGLAIDHEMYNEVWLTSRHDYASPCLPPVRGPVSFACAKSPGPCRGDATSAGLAGLLVGHARRENQRLEESWLKPVENAKRRAVLWSHIISGDLPKKFLAP